MIFYNFQSIIDISICLINKKDIFSIWPLEPQQGQFFTLKIKIEKFVIIKKINFNSSIKKSINLNEENFIFQYFFPPWFKM